MKLLASLFFVLTLGLVQATPTDDFLASKDNEAETNWPGIVYKIMLIQRLPPDRIVVGLYVQATDKAPLSGTLIGVPAKMPPHASAELIRSGLIHPTPYPFDSSVMTDELTNTPYHVLPPIKFGTQVFEPDAILSMIRPFQTRTLSMQFQLPPPPPPPQQGPQMISLLFTNAVAPIAHIPLPLPGEQYGTPPATSP